MSSIIITGNNKGKRNRESGRRMILDGENDENVMR